MFVFIRRIKFTHFKEIGKSICNTEKEYMRSESYQAPLYDIEKYKTEEQTQKNLHFPKSIKFQHHKSEKEICLNLSRVLEM